MPDVVKRLEQSALPERLKAAQKEAARNEEALRENPRAKVNRHHAAFLDKWWRLGYRRTDMLEEFQHVGRYIATSRVAALERPTVFEFVDPSVHPGMR
jgi:hypothetical protein